MPSVLRRSLCFALLLMFTLTASADVSSLPKGSYPADFILDRNCGSCRMLRGDVTLSVIIVNSYDAVWSRSETTALKNQINDALRTLERDAASYNVRLDLNTRYHTVNGSTDPDEKDWLKTLLGSIPSLNYNSLQDQPLLICLNLSGRAFARTCSNQEFAVVYAGDDAGVIRHELLHLYGAEDLYLHDEVEAAAKRRFPDSVMLDSSIESVVDPVTAYLVGWTDKPNAAATAFMNDIDHITAKEVEDARSANQQAGTGIFGHDNGTFYGTLERGWANGFGLQLWDNGNAYAGGWRLDKRDGVGVYLWANGDAYTGDFTDNKRTGRGTYTWADGDTYTGDYVNGQRTGKGTYTWASGSTYTGDFINGQRTGKGTYTWPNGDTYTGDFVDGSITGTGVFTWAGGSTYYGQFRNGLKHGFGVLEYSSGSVQSGTWANDVFMGN